MTVCFVLLSAYQWQCCVWTNPCGSYYELLLRHPSELTIRKLWKTQVYYLQEITYSEIAGIQRASMGLGFFYWGWGWGPRVLKTHSFMVNLKYENRHVKHEKKTGKKVAQMVSYRNHRRPLEQGSLSGGEALYQVMWLVMCFFQRWLSLKWMPSLKWMSGQSKLKSGPCII